MEWVEIIGRTVQEAVDGALNELGVDADDAEIVIVAEPRAGFLGIGRTPARVRARVRPATPRPKRPQRRHARGAQEASTSSGQNRPQALRRGGSPVTTQPKGAISDRPGGEEPAGGTGAGGGPGSQESSVESGEGRGSSARRRRRGGRGRSGSSPVSGGREPQEQSDGEEPQLSVDQQAAEAEDFIARLVAHFSPEARTSVRIEENHVFVDVRGDDLGLLVGPRGATIDALQELTRTVVQRRGEEHGTRVILDIAGYRERRAAALASFVERLGAEVLETGEPQALEPMTAPDRKVAHDTVNAIDGLSTSSEGVDPNRYVVIRLLEVAADPDGPEAGLDEDGTTADSE